MELEPWNLALNKPAYSSGLHPSDGTGKTEKYAVDGSIGTRWASRRTNDEWFYVDLEENCNVNAVNILWEAASAKEFKLQISNDGKTWIDMAHIKDNAVQGDWTNQVFSQEYIGRYVRMQGIVPNTKYGYSMYEFQVMGTTVNNPGIQDINSISFNDSQMNMLKGQTTTLAITTDPENVNASSIGWRSSDTSLVDVNNNGKIIVKGKSGYAIVTAYSLKNPTIKAESRINITPSAGKVIKVEGLTLYNTVYTLTLGDVHQLSAKVTPIDATHKYIIWSSSDESVIKVDADGKLEAVGLGVATISVKTTAGNEVSITITVKDVDKTALQIAVDMAENADLTDVVPAVVKEFNAALQEAKDILANVDATQEQVDTAFTRLAQAMHKLSFITGDKSSLKAMVARIEGLDSSKYIESTWNTMLPALKEAQVIIANENALKDDIMKAYDALVRVFLDLRLVPNKDVLDGLIKEAEVLNEPALANAIAQAKAVFNNPEATQTEVDNAVKALSEAINRLEAKPVQPGNQVPSVSTGDNVNMFVPMAGLVIAGAILIRRKLRLKK